MNWDTGCASMIFIAGCGTAIKSCITSIMDGLLFTKTISMELSISMEAKEITMNRGIKQIGTIVFTLLFTFTGIVTGCTKTDDEFVKSTQVIPDPDDIVTMITGQLAILTIDEMIDSSDAIVIGTVEEILPPQRGDNGAGRQIIYTDVILRVDSYLYGHSISDMVAVRVLGGKIGNEAMVAESQPVFYLGETVMVMLFSPYLYYEIAPVPPEGIDERYYFVVTGSLMGKWQYQNGTATDYQNKRVSVIEVEDKIATIHGETG